MKSLPRRLRLVFLGALLPFAASGCILAKENTIVLKFDDNSEKVSALLVHEGCFYPWTLPIPGQKPDEKVQRLRRANLDAAKKDLARFASNRDSIWLFCGLVDAIPFGPLNSLGPRPDDDDAMAEDKKALLARLDIEPGRFIRDEAGGLGAYQIVTVKNSKALETSVNLVLSAQFAKSAAENLSAPDPNLSAESNRRFDKAARDGHHWITISKGRITYHVPMTREDAEKTAAEAKKGGYIPGMIEPFEKSGTPIDFLAADDGLKVVIGDGKSRILRLPITESPDANPDRTLLDFARTLPGSFDEKQTPKALIEQFIAAP